MESTDSAFSTRLSQASQGDSETLGALLNEFRPWLRLLAERAMDARLTARIDASDVVQQTFLSAVRRINEFSGDSADAFVAWLRVIHERNLIDTFRKHVEAEQRAVDREQGQESAETRWDKDQPPPSQRLLAGESAVRLAQALSTLPSDQAMAVRLRYLDGWQLDQIAGQMDRTKRSVANLLHRGLANLRERIPPDRDSN